MDEKMRTLHSVSHERIPKNRSFIRAERAGRSTEQTYSELPHS